MSDRSNLVADWRFKEIQCIAQATVARAEYCLIGRLAAIAEKQFLKTHSHILFYVDPSLNLGEAKSKVAKMNMETDDGDHMIYYRIIIRFNGEMSTKNKWDATSRALLNELGKIIFFSKATKDRGEVDKELQASGLSQEEYVKKFVDRVIKKQPFNQYAVRPRFTLAQLHDIICTDETMKERKEHLLPYLHRVLYP